MRSFYLKQMQKINLISPIICILLVVGCRHSDDSQPIFFELGLGQGFMNDSTIISIDNQTYFDGTAQTDSVYNYAWFSGALPLNSGQHRCRIVVVASNAVFDQNIEIADNTTILAHYNRSTKSLEIETLDSIVNPPNVGFA